MAILDIEIDFTRVDGNAFAILGKVTGAMKQASIHRSTIDEFYNEATSGDYDNLLQTVFKWVDVSFNDEDEWDEDDEDDEDEWDEDDDYDS